MPLGFRPVHTHMPPRPYWSRSALTAHLGRLTEEVLKPRNGLRTAPNLILRRSDLEVEVSPLLDSRVRNRCHGRDRRLGHDDLAWKAVRSGLV
jgi:hypothetical protein